MQDCKTGFTGNGFHCSNCEISKNNCNLTIFVFCLFLDLNECQESGQGGCIQGCRNTIGGHDCFCNAGYTLNSDGVSCDGKMLYFVVLKIETNYKMSHCIRKPTTCMGENKAADQLCSNCTADQHLCFRYTVQFLFFSNPKFQASSLLL